MPKIDRDSAKRVGAQAYRLVRAYGRKTSYIHDGAKRRRIVEYERDGLFIQLRSPAPTGPAVEAIVPNGRGPREFELIVTIKAARLTPFADDREATLLRIAWDKSRSVVTYYWPGPWENRLDLAAKALRRA